MSRYAPRCVMLTVYISCRVAWTPGLLYSRYEDGIVKSLSKQRSHCLVATWLLIHRASTPSMPFSLIHACQPCAFP